MHELSHAVSQIPWWAWIPIVAIISGSITETMKKRYRHLERMEMIRQGIHPDSNTAKIPLNLDV